LSIQEITSNTFSVYSGSSSTNFNSTVVSLENDFWELAFPKKVDINANCPFKDYLFPNEDAPEGIKSHLDLSERGIIVSTGTERNFFNLLFSKEEKCDGIVVRDINQKVKAYIDFNVLLFRISETRAEYLELSQNVDLQDTESFKTRMKIILDKVKKSSLPERIKNYYLEHVEDFGSIYLRTQKNWQCEDSKYYKECRYDQNDDGFSKIQKYARAGNIISTIGEINDLSFLKGRIISVVDTSNICDYSLINLKGIDDSHSRIRVIWTRPTPRLTQYYSYSLDLLNDQEKNEFEELLGKLKQIKHEDEPSLTFALQNRLPKEPNAFDCSAGPFYSRKSLRGLKDYFEDRVLEVPCLGFVEMDTNNYKKLNRLSDEEIHQLCLNPKIKHFLPGLVENWRILDPFTYLAFSKVENWKEQVEKQFSSSAKNLDAFLNNLKICGILDKFTEIFSKQRLDALKQTAALR